MLTERLLRPLVLILAGLFVLSGCAAPEDHRQQDFDMTTFVSMAPADFRFVGIAPTGIGFTGEAEFHLRVMLPNDTTLIEKHYVLREVGRTTDATASTVQIAFALKKSDWNAFHLQQSALKSSLVAGFFNFSTETSSISICRAAGITLAPGGFTFAFQDAKRGVTISTDRSPQSDLRNFVDQDAYFCIE